MKQCAVGVNDFNIMLWCMTFLALVALLSAHQSWAFDDPDKVLTKELRRAADLQKTIVVSQASENLSTGIEVDIANVKKVLGTFTTKQGIFRKYVLVESDLSDDEVVEIAVQLHSLEPDTWFYLMDSDSEFDQMLAALPETENGNLDNWPSDYIEAHYVARTLEEIRGDSKGDTIRAWVVEGGPRRTSLVADI